MDFGNFISIFFILKYIINTFLYMLFFFKLLTCRKITSARNFKMVYSEEKIDYNT